MNIIGLIPARGGSKEIKDKNIFPLCGKPLIEYTIDVAERSHLDDWFVFTDKYFQYRTYNIPRPPQYSKGEYGSVLKWLRYAVEQYEKAKSHVDAVMILQPTSPLRSVNDINNAIHLFMEAQIYDCQSLYSGYYMRIKEKQKVDGKRVEPYFQRNGAIFITRRDLVNKDKIWNQNPIEFVMPKIRSIDIDDTDDLIMAESIIKHGGILWN